MTTKHEFYRIVVTEAHPDDPNIKLRNYLAYGGFIANIPWNPPFLTSTGEMVYSGIHDATGFDFAGSPLPAPFSGSPHLAITYPIPQDGIEQAAHDARIEMVRRFAPSAKYVKCTTTLKKKRRGK